MIVIIVTTLNGKNETFNDVIRFMMALDGSLTIRMYNSIDKMFLKNEWKVISIFQN